MTPSIPVLPRPTLDLGVAHELRKAAGALDGARGTLLVLCRGGHRVTENDVESACRVLLESPGVALALRVLAKALEREGA